MRESWVSRSGVGGVVVAADRGLKEVMLNCVGKKMRELKNKKKGDLSK
jgi:hypothetical protein